jgi:hypothetical protein
MIYYLCERKEQDSDQDLNPLVRIRIKKSQIRNTGMW